MGSLLLRYVSALLAFQAYAQSGDASIFAVAIVCHGTANELPNHPTVNLEIAGPAKAGKARPTHVRLEIPETGLSAIYPTAPLTLNGTRITAVIVQGQPLPEGTTSTSAIMSGSHQKITFDIQFTDATSGVGSLDFFSQYLTLHSTQGLENTYVTRSQKIKIPNLECWKI